MNKDPRPKRPARASLAGGDDVTVAAREVDRFVTVVPAHPIMLVAAFAGHDLDDLTLTAGLAYVDALNDESVTSDYAHGEPPFRCLPSPLLTSHLRAASLGTGPSSFGALSRIGERATEWFEEVAQHRLSLTQLLLVMTIVRIGDLESQLAQRGVEHVAEHSDMCIVDMEIHGSPVGSTQSFDRSSRRCSVVSTTAG